MQLLYSSIVLGALGLAFGLTLLIKPLLEFVVFTLLYVGIALITWYCASKKSQLITDKNKREVEDKLNQNQERFRELAENIQDVFWVFNPIEKQFLYVSPAYEKIWGASLNSLYANYMQWCEFIHPYDQAQVSTVCLREELEDEFNEEYRVIRPDGSIRWIRDRGVSLKDFEGQIYRVVGIAEDITEQKQAQEIINQLNQKLQRRISKL